MSKHYTVVDLDFGTFEALDESNFAITIKDEDLEPSAEAVLFIDVSSSPLKPDVVVMHKGNSSMDYSPDMEFSNQELKDIYAAILRFLYLEEYGNESLSLTGIAPTV